MGKAISFLLNLSGTDAELIVFAPIGRFLAPVSSQMKTSKKFGSRLCAVTGVGLLAVFYGPLVFDDVRAAFPGDALHAAALRDCALANTAFNRLDQVQRTDCYAIHQGLMRDAGTALNEIDLRMSAGRGHQPQNDVVQQQQLMDYFALRSAQRDR